MFCSLCEVIRINQASIGTRTDTASLGPAWEFHSIVTVFFFSFNNKYNTQYNGQTAQYWSKPYYWKRCIFISFHEVTIMLLKWNYLGEELQPWVITESVVGRWFYFLTKHHFTCSKTPNDAKCHSSLIPLMNLWWHKKPPCLFQFGDDPSNLVILPL